MPRLGNVNLLGVLAAGVVMYLIGMIWYGFLFDNLWMSANGLTEADFKNVNPAIMWGGGIAIPLVLAFGIGWFMKQRNISKLNTAVLLGLYLAILIGFPLIAYGFVYAPEHNLTNLMLDWGHTALSFIAGAAVLSFFD